MYRATIWCALVIMKRTWLSLCVEFLAANMEPRIVPRVRFKPIAETTKMAPELRIELDFG
jgi:hypothetical protein